MSQRFDPTDESLLLSFERKRQLIRDRVRGVAEGYHTAVCLVGRPGTSKTVTVKEELDRLEIPYVICNARMSPMGLFELLAEHPEHVIVLDDITTLLSNAQALQILTAALDGDPGQPRPVTYKTKNEDRKIDFCGGIIILANVPLRHTPLAQAVASRVVELEHEPTDEEIAAFMRSVAAKGYKGLSAEKCQEVVAFVIQETRAYDERLDLRHMTKAFDDRRQWEHKKSKTSWKDLIRTSLRKMIAAARMLLPISKQMEIARQRELVTEAMKLYPGDTKQQMEYCGLNKSTFYKRRKEVERAA